MSAPTLPSDIADIMRKGTAIPAHPLALTAARDLDERRQRALSRYYVDAGAGGLAVGVHTTQFAIREAGLYEAVLAVAAEEARAWSERPLVMVGGICGATAQALREAETARNLGYHAGLLSLAALGEADDDALIAHAEAVGEVMPLVGFYLQRAVGGRELSADFWRRFAAIPAVVGIKMAPFDRYRTIDVVRGVAEAGAQDRVTLYTGNDDHIVLDLITPHTVICEGRPVTLRIRGGLLGQWSVWTRTAVDILRRAQACAEDDTVPAALLTLDAQLTDANGALFDVHNAFHGCIAGCHEVLRRQGLLDNLVFLDPDEGLSPGQAAEIDRVTAAYPHLTDDGFVRSNLERWLA